MVFGLGVKKKLQYFKVSSEFDDNWMYLLTWDKASGILT
jgi:hypothetical protein